MKNILKWATAMEKRATAFLQNREKTTCNKKNMRALRQEGHRRPREVKKERPACNFPKNHTKTLSESEMRSIFCERVARRTPKS